MKCVYFGKIHISLIFPFLVPVFYTLRDVAFKGLFANNFNGHPILETFLMFISEFLCIFIEIPLYFIRKSKNTRISFSVQDGQLVVDEKMILEKPFKCCEFIVIFLIFLSALIDFVCFTGISFLCSYDAVQTNNVHTKMRILPVFFMGFLSLKILNFNIYKHHIFSILLIGFGFLLLMIGIMITVMSKVAFSIQFIILGIFLCIHIVYSCKQINDKYLLDHKYISPFLLLVYQGIAGMAITLVFYVVALYVPCRSDWKFCNPGPIFENFVTDWYIFAGNQEIILYLFLFLFSSIGLNSTLMLTKQKLTPSHRSVSDTMNAFFAGIVSIIYKWGGTYSYVDIAGFIIIMCGCLIYNEIIILHFCGLDKDTKYEITLRAGVKETSLISEELTNFEKNQIN